MRRLDRLARSTRDLLNTLATITDRKAGFRSLSDTWADTTTPHGRLMLAVLGGLSEFERDLIRPRTSARPPYRAGAERLLGSRPMAVIVAGLSCPVACNPRPCWKRSIAACMFGPQRPSTAPL
jgi:Resolvase, N terminal domain